MQGQLADVMAQRAGARLPAGTVLAGRYRLESLLGAGGCAVVWSARHVHLDSECAVKLLDLPLDVEPAERSARFLQEARVAAQLKSRHIIQVFDFGVHEQMPFLVMELLPGRSLAQQLESLREQGRRLSASDTARIVSQVAEALQVAHAARVVHRDLKPDNIFLAAQGGGQIAKVLDFGIAKWSAEEAPSRTATRLVMGTPHYMSPEQFESARQVDHRADLWSLAVIAFECLTGQLPFPGETFIDVAFRVCREGPLVASQLAPVPAGFERWFARATAQRREFRFGSALEQALALAELCAVPVPSSSWPAAHDPNTPPPAPRAPASDGAPAAGAPGSASGQRAPRRLRATWRSVAAVAASAALLTLGSWWLVTSGAARPSQPEARPVQRSFAVASGKAGLRVEGVGRLSLDGLDMGWLPQVLTGVGPGERTLAVSRGPRYRDFVRRVSLRAGETLELSVPPLEVRKGLLTLRSGANAQDVQLLLRVGSSRRVLPPLPLRVEIETERPHTLLARQAGFLPYEQPIVFEPGQAEKTLEINLRPQPGYAPP